MSFREIVMLFGGRVASSLFVLALAAAFLAPSPILADSHEKEDEIDMDAAGGEPVEPCDEGSDDREECKQSPVQERGTWIPSFAFKIKSERYGTCLRPRSTSNGARVSLYSCGNYTSRYWEPVEGRRGSGIKGEWNADWEYKLKNKWTGYCLKVNKPDRNSNGTLIQVDCRQAPFVNFVPSPNSPIGGEFHVIRGLDGTTVGATKAFCIRAVTAGRPEVQGSDNTTFQCANWSSLRWHRAPW